MIATTLLHDVALQFDPVGSWWLLGLVTLVLAAVLFFIGPDGSRVAARGRLLLVLLRLGAFLALVACMLRPTIVSSRKARPGRIPSAASGIEARRS